MPSVDEALSQIAEIRSQIAASTRFRGFTPAPFALSAAFCAVAAFVQQFWPELSLTSNVDFVRVWGVLLAGVTVIVTMESYHRTRQVHGELADMMLGAAVRRLAPSAAAMTAIASLICIYAPESAWVVPGIWLMLMALAGFSASAILPRAMGVVSLWFFVMGVLVLALAAMQHALKPWMMGAPLTIGFGAVSLVFGRFGEGGHGHEQI